MKKYLNHIFIFLIGIFAGVLVATFMHTPSEAMKDLQAKGIVVVDKEGMSYYANGNWLTSEEIESLAILSKGYKKISVFTLGEQKVLSNNN